MINSKNLNPIDLRHRVIISGPVATIRVYPRIHMFSIDLARTTRSGGMGFSVLSKPITVMVEKSLNGVDSIKSPVAEKDVFFALELYRRLKNSKTHWIVSVSGSIKSHIGLGSTTQVVGATIMAAAALEGHGLTVSELAELGVGQVTGVGTSLLISPGFLLELGYRSTSRYAEGYFKHPTIENLFEKPIGAAFNIETPKNWTAIVATPLKGLSLSGQEEKEFWQSILPTRIQESKEIGYEVLMSVLPAAITKDLGLFLDSLKLITSRGTKPNEISLQNDSTKMLIKDLESTFGFGGLSSLGPTVYSITDKPVEEPLMRFQKKYPQYSFTFFNLN